MAQIEARTQANRNKKKEEKQILTEDNQSKPDPFRPGGIFDPNFDPNKDLFNRADEGTSSSFIPESTSTGAINEGTILEKDGKTFIVSPEDLAIIKANEEKHLLGSQEIANNFQSIADIQRERKAAKLAQGVGILDPSISEDVKASEIDVSQAVGAGLGSIVPSALAGAGTAAVGASATVGLGTPAAIAAGTAVALGSIYRAVTGNIKAQRTGQAAASKGTLTDGLQNLKLIIREQNRNPANSVENSRTFNEQLSYIERDYGVLTLDTDGYLKDLTGVDGTPQLADYQRFYDSEKDILIQQMQDAIRNPDPSKALLTEQEAIDAGLLSND